MYQNSLIKNQNGNKFIPYFISVQSGILVQLLSAMQCGDCIKVQEIWDSTRVISVVCFFYNYQQNFLSFCQ